MAGGACEAFYLPRGHGAQCFCVLRGPRPAVARGSVLFVPPFAEELNKSRRMVALAAEALAREGWSVLQLDLAGCGDSSGNFGDASWDGWLDDVEAAHAWMRSQGARDVVLWGLRAGSLLISAWLARAGASCPVLLWQPVTNGKQHLNQFLRLKGVSGMLDEHDAKAVMATLRAQLSAGAMVEVAGYELGLDLVIGMERAALDLPTGFGDAVRLLEVCAASSPECSPAVAMLVERLRGRGLDVLACAIQGPSFWQAQEIEECAALVRETCVMLDELHASR